MFTNKKEKNHSFVLLYNREWAKVVLFATFNQNLNIIRHCCLFQCYTKQNLNFALVADETINNKVIKSIKSLQFITFYIKEWYYFYCTCNKLSLFLAWIQFTMSEVTRYRLKKISWNFLLIWNNGLENIITYQFFRRYIALNQICPL